MALELALTLVGLLVALWLRPWRLLGDGVLLSPLLAQLTLLSVLWSLPFWHHMPLQVHWSGAPLLTLMLGWPLAVPALVAVGLVVWGLSPADFAQALGLVVWKGLAPATFTLLLGAALRRWLPQHPFVYVLGRGFLGSVVCVFAGSLLGQWLGHGLPHVPAGLSSVAHWLMAWGDAFITGMLCAIFVAFRPQWLGTWSDRLYLQPGTPPERPR